VIKDVGGDTKDFFEGEFQKICYASSRKNSYSWIHQSDNQSNFPLNKVKPKDNMEK